MESSPVMIISTPTCSPSHHVTIVFKTWSPEILSRSTIFSLFSHGRSVNDRHTLWWSKLSCPRWSPGNMWWRPRKEWDRKEWHYGSGLWYCGMQLLVDFYRWEQGFIPVCQKYLSKEWSHGCPDRRERIRPQGNFEKSVNAVIINLGAFLCTVVETHRKLSKDWWNSWHYM